MSKNNGVIPTADSSTNSPLGRYLSSTRQQASSSRTNVIIPNRIASSSNSIGDSSVPSRVPYQASIRRPYTSVKRLTLTQSDYGDAESNDTDGGSSKRLRNSYGNFGSSNSLNDLQRPISRLSHASLSTNSSFTRPLGSGAASPNLLSLANREFSTMMQRQDKNHKSSFYEGRTSFGGANLRNNLSRFSSTPYSMNKVNYFTPTRSQPDSSVVTSGSNGKDDKTSLDSSLLGSATRRIYEKLERVATPYLNTSARSRIPTLSSLYPRPSLAASKSKSIRLFDSSLPNSTQPASKTLSSFKPKRFILTSVDEDDGTPAISPTGNGPNKPQAETQNDLRKLDEIIAAEKRLITEDSQRSSDIIIPKEATFGKISNRDIKKGRKINGDEEPVDSEHIATLDAVKPLAINSLIPFQFSFKKPPTSDNLQSSTKDESKWKFSSPAIVSTKAPEGLTSSSQWKFSSPVVATKEAVANERSSSQATTKLDISDGNAFSTTKSDTKQNDEQPKSLSLLFAKKSQQTWSCSVCSTENDSDANKCVACEEPNPSKKQASNTNAVSEPAPAIKFGFGQTSTTTASTTQPASTLSFFQKKSTGWSCGVCSTENDSDASKCVACEEPNPSKKSTDTQAATTPISTMKFGFGGINNSQTTAPSSPSLSSFIKKTKSGWSCPTCCVNNDEEMDKCVACEEPNPSKAKASTSVVASTLPSFGFKFGNFNTPATSTATPSTVNNNNNVEISGDTWVCYYCKASNNSIANQLKCAECDKNKTLAATKDEIAKFCSQQKITEFNFTKPGKIHSTSNEIEASAQSTTVNQFKFGEPIRTSAGATTTNTAINSIADNPAIKSNEQKATEEQPATTSSGFAFGDLGAKKPESISASTSSGLFKVPLFGSAEKEATKTTSTDPPKPGGLTFGSTLFAKSTVSVAEKPKSDTQATFTFSFAGKAASPLVENKEKNEIDKSNMPIASVQSTTASLLSTVSSPFSSYTFGAKSGNVEAATTTSSETPVLSLPSTTSATFSLTSPTTSSSVAPTVSSTPLFPFTANNTSGGECKPAAFDGNSFMPSAPKFGSTSSSLFSFGGAATSTAPMSVANTPTSIMTASTITPAFSMPATTSAAATLSSSTSSLFNFDSKLNSTFPSAVGGGSNENKTENKTGFVFNSEPSKMMFGATSATEAPKTLSQGLFNFGSANAATASSNAMNLSVPNVNIPTFGSTPSIAPGQPASSGFNFNASFNSTPALGATPAPGASLFTFGTQQNQQQPVNPGGFNFNFNANAAPTVGAGGSNMFAVPTPAMQPPPSAPMFGAPSIPQPTFPMAPMQGGANPFQVAPSDTLANRKLKFARRRFRQ